MTKILIIDDHPVIRQGLKQILEGKDHLSICGEAADGKEAFLLLHKYIYDVILLDISLPGENGIEVLKHIKTIAPKTPVIILSTYPENQYALRALKAGASSYLTKNVEPDILIEAIKKVSAGGKYITDSVADLMAEDMHRDSDALPHTYLPNREYEVLRKIAPGKTVTEIGEELSLSVKTISTYRIRVMKKMNMKTNAELTRYCFEHKLL